MKVMTQESDTTSQDSLSTDMFNNFLAIKDTKSKLEQNIALGLGDPLVNEYFLRSLVFLEIIQNQLLTSHYQNDKKITKHMTKPTHISNPTHDQSISSNEKKQTFEELLLHPICSLRIWHLVVISVVSVILLLYCTGKLSAMISLIKG